MGKVLRTFIVRTPVISLSQGEHLAGEEDGPHELHPRARPRIRPIHSCRSGTERATYGSRGPVGSRAFVGLPLSPPRPPRTDGDTMSESALLGPMQGCSPRAGERVGVDVVGSPAHLARAPPGVGGPFGEGPGR